MPVPSVQGLTARLYYRAVLGGTRIDDALRRSEALARDRARRAAEVEGRLRALLEDVSATVPFYRRLRREGFEPRSSGHGDLPVVTRARMQDAPEDFTAAPLPPGSVRSQTGGSSGTPMRFWLDPDHRARMRVDMYRGYRGCGYHPGDRALFVWGSDYDSQAHRGGLGRALDLWGYNRRWVNAFSAGPETLRQILDVVEEWRPTVLVAYAASAWLLARARAARGASGSAAPRAVQVTADLLTPTARAEIEAAFGAPVFNRYGCREVGNIAHECEVHAGLHVFEDSHLLEILDDAGRPLPAGRPGRIVVTNLRSRATPFLRYDLGDIGRLHAGACACGRSTPRLEIAEGRVGEIVTAPSGKWIHGEFFTHLFYRVEGVRRFRVVQEDLHHLLVQIESDGALREETVRFLDETIRREGDPAFRVRCERVAAIAPSPSGKYRFVESHVPLRVTA